MKEFINRLIGALDTHTKDSFSARKLSAFVIVVCVIAAHIKWMALGNLTDLGTVLTIDYTFISALLGLTTYEAIKRNNTTDSK